MASTVHTTVDVDVPVSTAYNQWTQFEDFPHFVDGVEELRQIDDTRTHWVVKVGGVRREFDAQIIEQTPDRVIAWRSTGGDTDGHDGRVMFEPLGPDRTKVDVALTWRPDGLLEKAGAAANIDQKQVNRSAERFKDFVESRGVETGAWRGDVTGGRPTG